MAVGSDQVKPFGIDVVVIEPGGVKSEWGGIAAQKVRKVSGSGPYAPQGNAVADSLTSEANEIREGDKVVMWFASGNRDEEVFGNPYDFDVARTDNDHVTFGKGSPHLCLGSLLARTEIRIMFEELIPRLASVRLTGEVPRVRSNFVNGIKHLPVEATLA